MFIKKKKLEKFISCTGWQTYNLFSRIRVDDDKDYRNICFNISHQLFSPLLSFGMFPAASEMPVLVCKNRQKKICCSFKGIPFNWSLQSVSVIFLYPSCTKNALECSIEIHYNFHKTVSKEKLSYRTILQSTLFKLPFDKMTKAIIVTC